ncbi:hypothetical protein PLICRDRAFT_25669 [Plicaturopsis crispa FD-325 SS-3]|nr:hypothetical protein PLICRDRAFT_25669 [Plicaturopsis crispa FD-325 SS-3]
MALRRSHLAAGLVRPRHNKRKFGDERSASSSRPAGDDHPSDSSDSAAAPTDTSPASNVDCESDTDASRDPTDFLGLADDLIRDSIFARDKPEIVDVNAIPRAASGRATKIPLIELFRFPRDLDGNIDGTMKLKTKAGSHFIGAEGWTRSWQHTVMADTPSQVETQTARDVDATTTTT